MRKKLIAAPYLLWSVLFIIAPMIFVVFYAFTDSNGNFSLANMVSLGDYLPTILSSLWLGFAAVVICLLISYPMAYFITQTKPTTQKMLMVLIMVPMCMSFLLRTKAIVSLLEDNGIINNFFDSLFGFRLALIGNRGAVILGMVYNYLPYMIMPLYTSLSKIEPAVIEAATDLGASKLHTFGRVVLPLSVPGIVSGVTMVFVPAVSTFYISNKLGGTSVYMIGDAIEAQFKSASYNVNLGAAMSLCLMALILICMAVVHKFSDDDEEISI